MYRKQDPSSYPLKVAFPPLASPSILDRVQSKPDVEGTLRQLRKLRLKERGNAVYIQPQAKAGVQAPDDQRFPLKEKVDEFLDSKQKVFLLLGDSGAGKSAFNQQLECDLWNIYKKATGRIPLYVNLPAIDKPDQDMIAKQLRKSEFTEPEIRELKTHREFILICDGYDESQQTHNLYMSNRLNQPGEWKAQMLISCRSEYLGIDYRDRFQPGDRNQRPEPGQFQEAVITPFTHDQIQGYIKQYVSVHQPLWEAKDYEQALDHIPSLKELVRNPFLMTLSLEVLPRMVDTGEHFSAVQVTRVALYDQFIEHWFERGKKRISEKELSSQAKAAFESLVDEGFTRNGVDFLKKLSTAIYKEQGGQPVVSYSRFKDGGSWKTEFFSREDEKHLLREACPLTRNSNQHRFIHRSLLEYGVALAIFDPHDWKEKALPSVGSGRRGSTSSDFSFHIHGSADEVVVPPVEQGPDINSPLSWRYFINDPSVLQFLSERALQQPIFKQQLLDYIEHSKKDPQWRIAASNAITILVRARIQFNGADLQGIRIPGADLSYGVFEGAQLQDADLRRVNLGSTWLRQADLSRAKMAAVQFGELPFLKEDSAVCSCAYSPDGMSFALGLRYGDINIYSTSSWDRGLELKGHRDRVTSIAYSPGGDRIVSGSHDDTVKLWDVETGTCIHILSGNSEGVDSVAFSPQGDTVASVGDNTVRVWDAGTGECRMILEGHTGALCGVMYSPKGNQIASGGFDNMVKLWDIETGICLRTMIGHSNMVLGVTYSPQGDRVVSGSSDRTVRIWDVETGECCHVLTGHGASVNTVAYSSQGDTIASGGIDLSVRIWDAETGTCRQVFTGHSKKSSCVAFTPRGDRIACASEDSTVRFWDVGSEGTRQFATRDLCGVESVYSPHGDQIASNSSDRSIRLMDAETGVNRCILAGHTHRIRTIAYSPRGDLIASGSDDRTVKLWGVGDGACRHTLHGHTNYVAVVAYSPRGDQIASGDDSGTLRLWDAATGACQHTLTGHIKTVIRIVYSPTGSQIACIMDETVHVWNAESGVCLHTLSGHTGYVASIAYSPCGGLLASASYDKTMRLWDMETGACRPISIGHTASILVIAYSPQGSQVTTGSSDQSVRIWDVGTSECLHTLTGHTNAVTCVVYSSNGHQVVSGSADMTTRLWNVTSGQCRAVVKGINSTIQSIAWSTISDANCFVAGYADGNVRMWQVVENGDACHVRQRWRTVNGELVLTDTLIQDVHGLSRLNKQLLKQRGAKGEPSDRLRETSKKAMQKHRCSLLSSDHQQK